MANELVPSATCIDTGPAFALLPELDRKDFPERRAYVRALLKRTAADLKQTAAFIEKEIESRFM